MKKKNSYEKVQFHKTTSNTLIGPQKANHGHASRTIIWGNKDPADTQLTLNPAL